MDYFLDGTFYGVSALHSLFNLLQECQTSFFFFFFLLHLSTRRSSELEHRWGGEEDGAGLHLGLPGLDTISAALEPIHLQRPGFYRVPNLLWLKSYTFFPSRSGSTSSQVRSYFRCRFTNKSFLLALTQVPRGRRCSRVVVLRSLCFCGWISHQGDAPVPLMKL